MNVVVHPRPRPLDFVSLCTGGGGLDLGLELAIPGARPVCLVEREAFAVGHLVEAMRQGLMAPAPVWSDARTFRGREWRGLVDGVIGGIPCQPHSLAGKRLGEEDERDLWSTARRIIVQSGAWFVLIENVGGMLTSGGAERVWRDLRRLGFTVEAGLFTAAEVGASHQRERLFLIGVADRNRQHDHRAGLGGPRRRVELADSSDVLADAKGRQQWGAWERNRGAQSCELPTGGHSGALVDAESDGRGEGRPEPSIHIGRYASAGASGSMGDASLGNGAGPGQSEAHYTETRIGEYRGPGAELADSDDGASQISEGDGSSGGWRPEQPARNRTGRRDIELFPPGPGAIDRWRDVLARTPHLEPSVCRMVDGVAARLDLSGPHAARVERLRMLGNGVVPLEAGYAVRTLLPRLAAAGSSAAAFLVRVMEGEA